MKIGKIIAGIVISVLIIWAIIAGISNTKKEAVTGDTVKVGVILPLTGDAAVYGEPARNVFNLATEEINAAGGVKGKKIQLILEDGKCSGDDAVSAAQKLVNIDAVQVIIGGFCSSEALAAIPVVEVKKVALFSSSASSPDLTGKSKYFFRNYPSDSSQGTVIAETAFAMGIKKVGFIQEQTDYALGIYKSFSAKFQELGGTIEKVEVPSSAKDFRSHLSKLKSDKMDAIFVDVQAPSTGDLIFQQMRQQGMKTRILLNDVIMGHGETVAKNKDLLEGAIGAEFGVDSTNPKYINFVNAYKAKYNADIMYASYAQTEYDAVYMVKDIIEAVGYDGEKIAEYGHTIKDWKGASGNVTVGSNGDRVGGHRAEIVKDGKVELYKK